MLKQRRHGTQPSYKRALGTRTNPDISRPSNDGLPATSKTRPQTARKIPVVQTEWDSSTPSRGWTCLSGTPTLGIGAPKVRSSNNRRHHDYTVSGANVQARSIHSAQKLCKPSTTTEIYSPIKAELLPLPGQLNSTLPIRERLSKWQEANGNPLSDLLGLDSVRGVAKQVTAENYRLSEYDENPRIEKAEDEIPETSDSQLGDDIPVGRGLFYMPGDMIELVSGANSNTAPIMAVYVRDIGPTQIQLFTMRGKWVNVSKNAIHFTLPNFIDPKVVEPIIPYLPVQEVVEELLDQAQVLDISPPREISGPIITALATFYNQTEEVYRKNAAVLDNAHEILAHETDLRFGTLDKIAEKLIGSHAHESQAALYAVRRSLLLSGIGFGTDLRSHRRTGVFQIRSKEQLSQIKIVRQWLRDYQEAEILRTTEEGLPEDVNSSLTKDEKNGVRIVRAFITKARDMIKQSRVDRQAIVPGCVGPSKQRFRLNAPGGTFRKYPGPTFDKDERMIVRFLENWTLQNLFEHDESLQSLAPLLLRGTKMYDQYNLTREDAFVFLQEIGVVEPFANRALYDINLLLPTSQHSRPLQQLASTLSRFTRDNVDLQDSMADIRHDFKDLPAFTIDNVDAKEIDDAISVERIQGSTSEFWLHIHVANPTAFLNREGVFAKMAAHLTESFYAPEMTYPLLPTWMSQEVFSLASGRPCLTFSAKLNLEGEIVDMKIQSGFLRNVISLSYDQLPEILGSMKVETGYQSLVVGGNIPKKKTQRPASLSPEQKEDLWLLQKLALSRYEYRRRNGGIYMVNEYPEATLYHKEGQYGLPPSYPHRITSMKIVGDPIIEVNGSPHRNWFDAPSTAPHEHLVREAMVLACEVAAKWCSERNVPIVYRGMVSDPLKGGKSASEEYDKNVVQPAVEKYGMVPSSVGMEYVRTFGLSVLAPSPVEHRIMGLDHYTKVTSPLRRYGDMIAHWQIEAALREESRNGAASLISSKTTNHSKLYLPFSTSQIANIITRLHPRERLIARAKSLCQSHWIAQLYFRAYEFGEADLPRRFRVFVALPIARRSTGQIQPGYGITLDHSVRLNIVTTSKEKAEEAIKNMQVGDIWEVEFHKVWPYRRTIEVVPVGLVERELE